MKKLAVYKPTKDAPWNFQRVWMLHRRACFGATWQELQRDLKDGPKKSLHRIFSGKVRTQGIPGNYSEMRKIIGEAAVHSDRIERMVAWWLYQMYVSPDPLRERMTLLWHNHFATSNSKVKSLPLMCEQNELFREHGLGEFKTLLKKTLKHPAMLIWLDGDKNRAGHPNENLGRELLELFTLGVGNYTEDDVKEVSRALTGWSVYESGFRQRSSWHDAKEKVILGQRGNFDGDDVIEISCDHQATAKRLAWRLCNEFLGESTIDQQVVDELAAVLRNNDLDIKVALNSLLSSRIFFSNENLKSRIVEPELFVVGNLRALENFNPPASTMVLGDWLDQMGRKLFQPPSVGGWTGGRSWLNTHTSIARTNFAVSLVNGQLNRHGRSPDLWRLAKSQTGSDDRSDATTFFCQLLTGQAFGSESIRKLVRTTDKIDELVALILASPQAQLS